MGLLAEYSGAKAFNEMFSKGLKAKLRKTSLTIPSPQSYARSAVAHIGYEDTVSPYWSHALQLWAQRQLPEWAIIAVLTNMHKGIRKAGMKKEARLAEEAK